MNHTKLMSKEHLTAWIQIVLGCLLAAAAFPWFLVPNHIAPGGVTGLSTVLNYLFQWPVGMTSLILNVPLFLIGYRAMGRMFAIRSLAATVLLSVFIDILPLDALTADPLLSALFGGVLMGAGLGLVLRGGATTGGTDMVAKVIHERVPHLSVGSILFVIDCIVVLMAGFYIEIEYALYAFISLYASSKVINAVLDGLTTEKACYVISLKHQQVKDGLMEELDRGVTMLSATGGYSNMERPVLLCVVSAQEVGRVKAIVRRVDKEAFVFISDAHEVLGEGFKRLE